MATGPPTYGLQTPKETTAEQLDQTMNPGPNIPWLNFSGSPEESVITFIQSVQRVAIMLNNMYEDRWLAHYAAACLGGAALLWYSELDDETCDSWKKLRKALLANYYAIKPGAGTLNSVPAPQSWDLAAPASLTSPPSPPISLALTESPSSSAVLIEKRGRVEVFRYDYPESLGFIGPGFSVVPNQGQAAVFTFAQNPDGAPFALHRVQ
ncbi:hypothetical protein FRB90_005283 [Tulasnella sp. 427]|nr:hypothetical protein FRB90_005283 [Tulasnella sp. 427]